MRLVGVALLFVPQLQLPGLTVQLASVAIIWTLFTCLAGILDRRRSPAASPLVAIAVTFTLVTAVSLLWALPDASGNGLATVVRSAVFALWLREVIVLARDDPKVLDFFALWAVPGVALQSILTIIFRLSPATEYRFLSSEIGSVTVGRQAVSLYADWSNNVVYPFKAGGLFVNGNIASMFGGVAACMLFVAARRTGRRLLFVFAGLAVTGALFTGSKTAIFVVLIWAVALLLLPRIHNLWLMAGAMLASALLLLLLSESVTGLLERFAPQLQAASERSYSGRVAMWDGGYELFRSSPFLGLGFGGWGEQIGRYTGAYGQPPHNFIIAAWANSGVVAAALTLAFVFTGIALALRCIVVQASIRDRRTAVVAGLAVLWVFVHGMADNTTFYGEQRSMYLFALAIGYLYLMTGEGEHRGEKRPEPAGTLRSNGPALRSTLVGPSTSVGRFLESSPTKVLPMSPLSAVAPFRCEFSRRTDGGNR